jgi:hypothetical protein
MTIDTLQFKNNVGEVYNAPVIAGDVALTNTTYDVAKRLFTEKTKSDNSSLFFELEEVCENIFHALKKQGKNSITKKDVTTIVRNTYRVKSLDKETGRVLKNKSFDNAISRASMLAEMKFLGIGQISVELLGKAKRPTITVQQKAIVDKVQEISFDDEGKEIKTWQTPDESRRVPITIDGMEKLYARTFKGKDGPNASTSSHPIYKMIELMRRCVKEPSYSNMIMEKFYNSNFSEKEHADVKTIVDSDNDFKELFEDFNVAIIQSLNAVVDKADAQTEKEDRKEKERIKKPAKV